MKCSKVKKNGTPKRLAFVLLKSLQFLLKISPLYVIVMLILAILHAGVQAVNFSIYQDLFERIASAINNDGNITHIITLIILVTVVELGTILIQFVINVFCNDFLSKKLYASIAKAIHQKSTSVPLIHYEETGLFDDIDKALHSIQNSVDGVMKVFNILWYYIPFFIVVTFILMKFDYRLGLILLMTFCPIIVNQIISSKEIVKNENRIANIRRQSKHFEECIADRNYAKETRSLGAYQYLTGRMCDMLQKHNKADNYYLNVKFGEIWAIFLIELTKNALTLTLLCVGIAKKSPVLIELACFLIGSHKSLTMKFSNRL